MALPLEDTIAAIATPAGKSGIGVIRLSGPQSKTIAQSLCRPPKELQPRRPTLCELADPFHHEPLDQAMLTYFAAPRTFTRQDIVEISCHGSPVLLGAVMKALLAAGAKLAGPGEFTLRAFLNGRIDLVEAEAIRDLIEAKTLHQARVAHQQACGALSRRLQPLKASLVDLIALLEAGIDFADDDVAVPEEADVERHLLPLEAAVEALCKSYSFGKLLSDGMTLAILGRPNVGKSSLFNALLEEERAIVTEIPGTTRDLISETGQIQGIPVRLLDTAGIRQASDQLEQLGIDKSYEALADADSILLVVDGAQPLEVDDWNLEKMLEGRAYHLVVNKADLGCKAELDEFAKKARTASHISAKTGAGIENLKKKIIPGAEESAQLEAEGSLVTNLRQEQLLQEALRGMCRSRQSLKCQNPHEIVLLDLYAALKALNALTGETTVEDILVQIFSKFCIGK